jgi:hypothetical protein
MYVGVPVGPTASFFWRGVRRPREWENLEMQCLRIKHCIPKFSTPFMGPEEKKGNRRENHVEGKI